MQPPPVPPGAAGTTAGPGPNRAARQGAPCGGAAPAPSARAAPDPAPSPQAGPGRAQPDRGQRSRAAPGRAGLLRAGPGRARHSRAVQGRGRQPRPAAPPRAASGLRRNRARAATAPPHPALRDSSAGPWKKRSARRGGGTASHAPGRPGAGLAGPRPDGYCSAGQGTGVTPLYGGQRPPRRPRSCRVPPEGSADSAPFPPSPGPAARPLGESQPAPGWGAVDAAAGTEPPRRREGEREGGTEKAGRRRCRLHGDTGSSCPGLPVLKHSPAPRVSAYVPRGSAARALGSGNAKATK